MLILSRRIGEQIQIGEHVCITVVRIGQGGVRIGVEAPEGFSIVRHEIHGQTVENGGAAALESAGGSCRPST